MYKLCVKIFLICFYGSFGVLCTPQYYVDDLPPTPSLGSSWNAFHRYGAFNPSPAQYYPSSSNTPNAFDTQSNTFYQNGFGTGISSVPSNAPNTLDALLMRPLLVIDSQVFAMYQLIKCWEKHGELKKCVKLIEKCDQLFKKRNRDSDEDDDKKKGKKGKKGRGKKGKRTKKKNPDSESADGQNDYDEDDQDDEENEDEDEDDERED